MTIKHTEPLARLIYDHENISEFVENYEMIMNLKYAHNKWHNMEEVKDFFRVNIVEHIAFEEDIIFPALLNHAPNRTLATKLVVDLLNEHDTLKAQLDIIIKKLENISFPISHKEHLFILDTVLPFLNKIQEHAALEDNKLIPMIKRILHVFSKPADQQ